MKKTIIMIILILLPLIALHGSDWKILEGLGRSTVIQCNSAPFPHEARSSGYSYDDSLYDFDNHYNDSGITLFVPDNYRTEKKVDLVFYFHGWWNSVENSMKTFKLADQFITANKNAILVMPETAKNAPDSFGGKLEEKEVFSNLVEEVLAFLHQEGVTTSHKPGKIILSGHSGAYRVIASILNRGGLTDNIAEVYLLDALYGQTEKFAHWIEKYPGRFINIITPEGGTLAESQNFIQALDDWQIDVHRIDGDAFDPGRNRSERIIFMFTNLGHNDVVNPFFGLFLKSGMLFDRY